MTTPLDQKKQYLDLLAIGYYITGGLAALFSLLALIYIILGGAMVAAPQNFGPDEPPAFVGCFLIVFGVGFLLVGWAYSIATILAGRYLARRQKPTFILVMAGINCMFAPIGTVIGVFTIVLMVQPEVRALFDQTAPSSLPAEAD